MTIRYIQFRQDVAVSIGGRGVPSAINAWDPTKHAEHIDVEITKDGVYLYPKVGGERTGRRKTLPMSSVSYVDEEFETAPKGKAK